MNPDKPLDLGALGEAMLFYGEVRLFADRGVITQLIRDLTPSELSTALEEGYLRITYVNGSHGIRTENTGTPFERHQPISIQIPEAWNFDDAVDAAFALRTDGESKARKLRRKLSPYVEQYKWDESVLAAARADFVSNEYVVEAARSIVRAAAPSLGSLDQLTFEVRSRDDHFSVETDIDFLLVNQSFHQHTPPEVASITPAFILSELVESEVQLHLSAISESDLATDAMTSQVLELKCEDVIARSDANSKKLELFQDRVLNGRAVREAINRGDRSFSDLLKVISRARKFRSWVDAQEDDRDLLDAYYEEIIRISWINHLPTRMVRWALFGAAGLALTPLGVPVVAAGAGSLALGAFDGLLLDKLGRGWRPNQFIDTKLTRFVRD